MAHALGFTVLVAPLDNAGTANQEPARDRRYTIVATPLDDGKVWRAELLNEQQYRDAIASLIPEKRDRMPGATTSRGSWSPGMAGELVFSTEEIQRMGLVESRGRESFD